MVLDKMVQYRGKFAKKIGEDKIKSYELLYCHLTDKVEKGELPSHEEYLGGNDLAENIYKNKYFLKNLEGEQLEKRPEDVFIRMASFIATAEKSKDKQMKWAEKFYLDLYRG